MRSSPSCSGSGDGFGEDLVGAYVQGSFALGSGDQNSDCDWLVATWLAV